MIILDVPPLPATAQSGFIIWVLLGIFLALLLGIGIFILVKYLKNKDKK
ncbi:MAG: LPXTG cell wall anchor domain-containing protein [Roseburia sp.]|nr:LPXTG cell wall anchor domain-containing protein [Anaeroplasma bactoclasticum]MCM1196328.1 LPXTG cell wall anchor domain-containing protein [Roseburia sp.]MCM1557561.1 LPXTG cell wall anchor domain-containing protein [Anaeroplasma bactoclasticum]